MKIIRTRGYRSSLLALLAGTFLSGCAVQPVAFTSAEHDMRAQMAMAELAQGSNRERERLSGPLTLYQAMARALRDNLDYKVRVMEEALANRQLDMSRMDMLPTLAANAGYEGRDKWMASSSRSMRTGTESLEMSSSQDRDRTVADLTLSWNILDFGLSYVRANQMADRQLMAGEKRRKVIHNITQEVRISYWRAVSADRILRRVDPLIARLDKAWKAARDNETTRLQDPVKALYYQRDLAEMQRRLQSLRKNLITARTELATLMNLRPNESFELPQVPEQEWEQSRIEPAMSLETMEQMALSHRPEVREQAYQNRVSAQEVKAQTLAMLPGIRLDLGNHHDSNSYLMESDWNSAGAAVSWNLFNIFRGPAMINVAEAQVEAEKVRAQALNVAVLAQVHIAMHQFRHARQEHDVESNYLQVQQRILKQTAGHVAAGRTGELEEIREALSMLVAEVQRDQAFIQLQSSLSRLQASIGLDPLPESVESHEIDVLAKALEDRFKGFSRHVVGQ